MALPEWPNISYEPRRDSWRKDPLRPPIRTEMEGGNIRIRRRPGDNVAIISQTVELTQDELNTLDAWVSTTLGGGVARFSMLVFLGGPVFVSKTVQFEAGSESFPYAVGEVAKDKFAVSMRLRVYGV